MLWEPWRSLCSQISIRETRNVKYLGLPPQMEGCIICYQHRGLGEDVVNSLVTFVLSVWLRAHRILLQTLIMSSSIYRTCLYGKCHLYFTNRSEVVRSWALLYTQDWVNCQQEGFHQIGLCLNMPEINYSGSNSPSLNHTSCLVMLKQTTSCVPQTIALLAMGVQGPLKERQWP